MRVEVERLRPVVKRAALALAMLSLACVPAGRGPSSTTKTPASPDAAHGSAPCPAIDYATLEPATTPDTRTIPLTRVFVREEARDQVVTVPAPFDLDVTRVRRDGPAPKGGGGIGLGWQGLQASSVASTTSAEVAAPLAAWDAARKELGEHQRGSYLLDTRARYARSVEPPAAWGGRRCVNEAAAQAERDEQQAEAVVERAAAELRAVLEKLPSLEPGDAVLLGYLLADELPYPYDPKATARPIELFTAVANDASVDRELRARAAEQLARLHGPSSKAFAGALEQVLSLTRDPELSIATQIKLADLEPDPAKAEARRVKLVEALDQRGGEWPLAKTLADLAYARLDRGAFELARDDAARCARASAADVPRDPDPWGCAPVLAEALAELSAAPEKVEVPLAFLGPLAIASMDAALQRRDWNQARHVGTLLLAELPAAAEAPEALTMLMALARSDDERAALAARKAREHGPDGAWAAAQRERLAWEHEPEEARQRLAELLEPDRRLPVVREPSTPAELTAELRVRAALVAESCIDVLPKGRRPITIGLATAGTTPVVTVRGAKPAAAACLQRSTASRFRSVGPVQITFGVALE